MSALWKVEHFFSPNSGWGDAEWTDGDQPMRFDSKAEAEEEIRSHVANCKEAVAYGSMTSAPFIKDFRAVRVGKTITEQAREANGRIHL